MHCHIFSEFDKLDCQKYGTFNLSSWRMFGGWRLRSTLGFIECYNSIGYNITRTFWSYHPDGYTDLKGIYGTIERNFINFSK